MGLFADDRIVTARGTEGGIYFLPGNYLVEIMRCKEGVSFKRKDFFVAECKILESDNPARKVGTPCSFMVTVDEYPDLSYGNIADFIRAAMAAKLYEHDGTALSAKQISEIEYTKKEAQDVVGEENSLVGIKLRLFAFNKPTKAGNDFTRHKWSLPTADADAAS